MTDSNLELTRSASAHLRIAAAVAAGLTVGMLALTITLQSSPPQSYHELVSGGLSLIDGRKVGDIAAWPVAVLSGVVTGLLASASIRKQTGNAGTALATHLLWWSLPAAAATAALVSVTSLSNLAVAFSVVAVLFLITAAWFSRRRGHPVAPVSLSVSMFGIIAWTLAPLGFAVAVARLPGLASVAGDVPWTLLALTAGAVALGTQVVAACLNPESFGHQAVRFTGLAQLFLPLLLFAFLPAKIELPGGALTAYHTRSLLPVGVSLLVAAGIFTAARRMRSIAQAEPDQASLASLVRPFPVLAVLLVSMFGVTHPPVVSSDDYHYGETLLGWLAYRGGQLPFVGYQPPHGLVQDDFASLLGSVFYDGTAASHSEANRVACALLTGLLFAVCWWATRRLNLSIVIVLAGAGAAMQSIPGPMTTWAFILIIGWLWLAPSLRGRPISWLTCWVLTAPLVVLGAAAQGLVLVGASVFLAIGPMVRVLRPRPSRALAIPGSVALCVILLSALTPLGAMLIGALSYAVRNGAVNLVAYGVPWMPAPVGPDGSPWVSDLARMSWVIGPVLCLIVVWSEFRRRPLTNELLASALFFLAFLTGVLPYVMGRIDVGYPSRAGLATGFVLALVVPVLAWSRFTRAGQAGVALAMVMVVSAMNGVPAVLDDLGAATAPAVAAPALVDGSTEGLPGWGQAAAEDPSQLDQVIRLGRILNARLGAGEPYFDATSRNAQYFYLGRRPVTAVTATYNMPLPEDQRRAVARLRATRPAIAVLAQPFGNLTHDGGGLALRTPLLAHFLESVYVPYERDGFILGDRQQGIADADRTVVLPLNEVTDGLWDRGVSRKGASVLLADGRAAPMLRPGSILRLWDGSTRRVSSVSGRRGVVRLAGPPSRELTSREPLTVTADVNDLRSDVYRAWLFERAFGTSDLGRLPTAWGRSASLIHDMRPVGRPTGGGVLGQGKKWIDLTPPLTVRSGLDADLLAFHAACTEGVGVPRLRISWWGGDIGRPFEAAGRTLTVGEPSQLVPLDSSPMWYLAGSVEGLRVTLVEAGGCTQVKISDLEMYRRTWN